MASAGIIVVFVILIILDIIFIILAIVNKGYLTTCESTEGPYCPTYYCSTPTTACGNAPYRVVNGNQVCQEYILKSASTPYT